MTVGRHNREHTAAVADCGGSALVLVPEPDLGPQIEWHTLELMRRGWMTGSHVNRSTV